MARSATDESDRDPGAVERRYRSWKHLAYPGSSPAPIGRSCGGRYTKQSKTGCSTKGNPSRVVGGRTVRRRRSSETSPTGAGTAASSKRSSDPGANTGGRRFAGPLRALADPLAGRLPVRHVLEGRALQHPSQC